MSLLAHCFFYTVPHFLSPLSLSLVLSSFLSSYLSFNLLSLDKAFARNLCGKNGINQRARTCAKSRGTLNLLWSGRGQLPFWHWTFYETGSSELFLKPSSWDYYYSYYVITFFRFYCLRQNCSCLIWITLFCFKGICSTKTLFFVLLKMFKKSGEKTGPRDYYEKRK